MSKCPYCGSKLTGELAIPPMSVRQRNIYDSVVNAGKDGISQGDARVVTTTALLMAALAILDAGLGLVSRWYSSRIGEGLIFDLRVKLFDHVQRMPIAFFTRTQTGALVSRMNNDVIGAQQALTGTLGSVVSNGVTLGVTLAAMGVLFVASPFVVRLNREWRVDALMQRAGYEGEIIGVDIPASVELTVTETEPGIQGDRVSGARKPATLETGVTIEVPLFIEEGEKVRVDTRSGAYVSRS